MPTLPSRQRPSAATLRAPKSFLSRSAAATRALGGDVAKQLLPGDVVLLLGNLGSGKTVFVRGLAKKLGVRGPVVSPTFVLRKRYPLHRGNIVALNHLDAYRLTDTADLRGLLDDEVALATRELWCIEWGGKLRSRLPKKLWLVRMSVRAEHERAIHVTPPLRRS